MKNEVLLAQLEDVASKLDVRVSYEPLQAATLVGGMCRVRGEYRVIIDKRATVSERVVTLARCLARFGVSVIEQKVASSGGLAGEVKNLLRDYAVARG